MSYEIGFIYVSFIVFIKIINNIHTFYYYYRRSNSFSCFFIKSRSILV